jgi:hypothetical protein
MTAKPRKRLKRYELASERPKIDIVDARSSWFVYGGGAYPVESAPSSIFRSAVLRIAKNWHMHDEYGPILMCDDIEFISRWFILNELCYVARGMQLYVSREQAMMDVSSIAIASLSR